MSGEGCPPDFQHLSVSSCFVLTWRYGMRQELSGICVPKTPYGLFSYQLRANLRDLIPATLKFRTAKHDSVKDTNVLITTPVAHSTVGQRVIWAVVSSSK